MKPPEIVAWRKTHKFGAGRTDYTYTHDPEAVAAWEERGEPLEPLVRLSDVRSYAEEAVKQERERAASWLDFYDGKGKRRAEAIRAGDHHDFRARSEG